MGSGGVLESINDQGFTPLKISIRKGDLKMTELFLDYYRLFYSYYDRLAPYLTYAWSFCYGLESEYDGDCVNDENGDRKKILNILQDRVLSVRPEARVQPVPIPETDGMNVSDEGKRTWETKSDIIPSSIIPNDIETIVLGGHKTKKNRKFRKKIKKNTQRKKHKGKKRGKKLNKTGWLCSDTAELVFEDVRVTGDDILGKVNKGFYAIMKNFQNERTVMGAMAMGEAQKAYDAKRCDVFCTDKYGLGARRLAMTNPDEHMILPETISNEPISPMVGHGDQVWKDIVVWTFNSLIAAEEFGITSKNVDEMRSSAKNPFVQRILGTTGKFGAKIGLGKDWAYNAIKAVGNYGEMWEKHLGKDSRLKMGRGKNILHTKGGLLISPPFR
jgi:hypothetical protein